MKPKQKIMYLHLMICCLQFILLSPFSTYAIFDRRPIRVKSPETINRIHQHYITQYKLEQWKQNPIHTLANEYQTVVPNTQNIRRHNDILWQRFLYSEWDDLTLAAHNHTTWI